MGKASFCPRSNSIRSRQLKVICKETHRSCNVMDYTFTVKSLKCCSVLSSMQDNLDRLQHSSSNGTPQTRSPQKNTPSPERNKHCVAARSYEQPTIASVSRSPSPYTKRRMCELEEARQRLAHLNLGPFEFRKEQDRPPFIIRHVCVSLLTVLV